MSKNIFYGIISLILIAAQFAAEGKAVHTVLSVVYIAYLILLAVIMIKKADRFTKKVDSIGNWEDILAKIAEINPDERAPSKNSAQRYIWLAFKNYDLGDAEIKRLKEEYKPSVILFYGSLIIYIFAILV